MLDEINLAFEEKNYDLVQELIEKLEIEQPDNPWLEFYQGLLQEEKGELELAEKSYKKVLFNTLNRQILSQTRKRLEHLVDRQKNRVKDKLEQALQEAKKEHTNDEIGLLILEPIEAELKKPLAEKLAKIMDIDPFTARLQLPTKNWRLYKVGNFPELLSYRDTLLGENIPCFSVSLKELETIQVYQVKYIESINAEVTVICEQKNNETISFKWPEITQGVEALLPIFESSLEIDNKRNLYRKIKTLDYVQICDLHLRDKNMIIRFGDYQYKFAQGLNIPKQNKGETNRENWNNLKHFLQPYLVNIYVSHDFNSFAEKALDFPEMLKNIKPNITLFRREDSLWDHAFELYTGLILIHSKL